MLTLFELAVESSRAEEEIGFGSVSALLEVLAALFVWDTALRLRTHILGAHVRKEALIILSASLVDSPLALRGTQDALLQDILFPESGLAWACRVSDAHCLFGQLSRIFIQGWSISLSRCEICVTRFLHLDSAALLRSIHLDFALSLSDR